MENKDIKKHEHGHEHGHNHAHEHEHEHGEEITLKQVIISVVLLAAGLILKWTVKPDFFLIELLFFLPAYVYSGFGVIKECIENIKNKEFFDENFLMTIATLGAFCIGEFPEAAAVMVLYKIGEFLEDKASDKSREKIKAVSNIRPETATVIRNGAEITVSPDEVEKGEIIILRPGDRIPLDGTVTEGETDINTASITGESLPVGAGPGDKVVSGTVNLSGVIKVRVDCEYRESTVARILRLTEESAEKKSRSEKFITRFSKIYTPAVVCFALALAVIPSIITGNPAEWIRRALIFLVVSCPCALVISVPLAFFGGIGSASGRGILIKGSAYVDSLSGVKTVVFDKTGTLTTGEFEVSAVHPNGISEESLLKIAAYAECRSTHPAAEAIKRRFGGEIDGDAVTEITELPGLGIEAEIAGKKVYAGNLGLMEKIGVCDDKCVHKEETLIHIAQSDRYLGHISMRDKIKDSAKDAVSALYENGVEKTVMLTGDREDVAASVARNLGIDEYAAALLPADKVREVESLLEEKNGNVCMVGDGINDAPVLTRADVGIAMGGIGSDAAVEAADVIITDDAPEKIAEAINISKHTLKIAKQNIAFSLAVKGIVLILGALGIANMWLAVFADVGVTFLAVLNAGRALRYKKPPER